jgi:hypothetical protein
VDNIKMNLKRDRLGGMDWIDLAHNRSSAGLFEHGNEPSGSKKIWEVLE